MDNILVAIEPTDEGNHVWQIASQVAKTHKVSPVVVNVIEPAIHVYADLNFTPLIECASDWQNALTKEHFAYFNEIAPCLKDEKDSVRVVEGNPAYEISRMADKLDTDLIVMGLHNRRGIQRLLGSTTHGVLNHTKRDLLAVHPETKTGDYQKIVVAVDTTDLLETVLERAKQFVQPDAVVDVVTVMVPLATVFASPETMRWSFEELTTDVKRESKARVNAAVDKSGLDAEVTLRIGDPREEILAAAEALDADLIIMGGNNRGVVNRTLLGSTARAVLDRASCDVLVVRPD